MRGAQRGRAGGGARGRGRGAAGTHVSKGLCQWQPAETLVSFPAQSLAQKTPLPRIGPCPYRLCLPASSVCMHCVSGTEAVSCYVCFLLSQAACKAGLFACNYQQASNDLMRFTWADEEYPSQLDAASPDFVVKKRTAEKGGDWTLEVSKQRRVGNKSIFPRFRLCEKICDNLINPAWVQLCPSGKLPSGEPPVRTSRVCVRVPSCTVRIPPGSPMHEFIRAGTQLEDMLRKLEYFLQLHDENGKRKPAKRPRPEHPHTTTRVTQGPNDAAAYDNDQWMQMVEDTREQEQNLGNLGGTVFQVDAQEEALLAPPGGEDAEADDEEAEGNEPDTEAPVGEIYDASEITADQAQNAYDPAFATKHPYYLTWVRMGPAGEKESAFMPRTGIDQGIPPRSRDAQRGTVQAAAGVNRVGLDLAPVGMGLPHFQVNRLQPPSPGQHLQVPPARVDSPGSSSVTSNRERDNAGRRHLWEVASMVHSNLLTALAMEIKNKERVHELAQQTWGHCRSSFSGSTDPEQQKRLQQAEQACYAASLTLMELYNKPLPDMAETVAKVEGRSLNL